MVKRHRLGKGELIGHNLSVLPDLLLISLHTAAQWSSAVISTVCGKVGIEFTSLVSVPKESIVKLKAVFTIVFKQPTYTN